MGIDRSKKCLLINNMTGEELEIFTFSEQVIFRNEVEDTPIEVLSGGIGPFSAPDSLAKHIKFLPMIVELVGVLVNAPEEWGAVSTYGGWKSGIYSPTSVSAPEAPPVSGGLRPGRPIERFERGRLFSNQITTFTYLTPNYPGHSFDDLVIQEYSVLAHNQLHNAYDVRISLKSVLLTIAGREMSAEQKKTFLGTKPTKVSPLEAILRGPMGMLMEFLFGGTRDQVRNYMTLQNAQGATDTPVLDVQRGSIPWQVFETPLEGQSFEFEIRWGYPGAASFSMSLNGSPIVTGRKIVIGQDLLETVQWDERVRDLHIIPWVVIPATAITEENLGAGVELFVIPSTG